MVAVDDQQRAYQELASALKEEDRLQAEALREKRELEQQKVIMGLQLRKLQRYDRIDAPALDPEAHGKIMDLRNQLTQERRQQHKALSGRGSATPRGFTGNQSLQQSLNAAESLLEKKLVRIEELHAELEEVKSRTNWSNTSKGPAVQRDWQAADNRIRELKIALSKMQDEQELQKRESRKKTEVIEELAEELDKLHPNEQLQAQLLEQRQDLERKKEDLQEQINTAHRIWSKKEIVMKRIKHHKDTKEPLNLRSLESEKRVLQHEIKKQADARLNVEKTLQSQHQRILSLDNKLSSYAAAIKSLKRPGITDDDPAVLHYRPNVPPGATRVDAQLFDDVQRNLDEARRGLETKDVLLLERDATIESLEKKVEIHQHAKLSMLRRLQMEKAQLERVQDTFKQQYQLAEEEQERTVKHLRRLDEAARYGR